MTRARLNTIVDIVAFPVFLLSIFSGIVPEKVLPGGGGGPGAGREAADELFLGLARGEWRGIHVLC